MLHDWTDSKLGHGETMCRRCFITNREAAALGVLTTCDVPPNAPAANENQERIDAEMEISGEIDDDDGDDEDDWLEMECGLAADGQCSQAGSEHCDFTCPYRDSEDFAGSAAWNKKHGG